MLHASVLLLAAAVQSEWVEIEPDALWERTMRCEVEESSELLPGMEIPPVIEVWLQADPENILNMTLELSSETGERLQKSSSLQCLTEAPYEDSVGNPVAGDVFACHLLAASNRWITYYGDQYEDRFTMVVMFDPAAADTQVALLKGNCT